MQALYIETARALENRAKNWARRYGHTIVILSHKNIKKEFTFRRITRPLKALAAIVALLKERRYTEAVLRNADSLLARLNAPNEGDEAPERDMSLHLEWPVSLGGALHEHRLLTYRQQHPEAVQVVEYSADDAAVNRDAELVVDTVIRLGLHAVTIAGGTGDMTEARRTLLKRLFAERHNTDMEYMPPMIAVDELLDGARVQSDRRHYIVIDRAHRLGTREHYHWFLASATEVVLIGAKGALPARPGLTLAHLASTSGPYVPLPTPERFHVSYWASDLGHAFKDMSSCLTHEAALQLAKGTGRAYVLETGDFHGKGFESEPYARNYRILRITVHRMLPLRDYFVVNPTQARPLLILERTVLERLTSDEWVSFYLGYWTPCVIVDADRRPPLTVGESGKMGRYLEEKMRASQTFKRTLAYERYSDDGTESTSTAGTA